MGLQKCLFVGDVGSEKLLNVLLPNIEISGFKKYIHKNYGILFTQYPQDQDHIHSFWTQTLPQFG